MIRIARFFMLASVGLLGGFFAASASASTLTNLFSFTGLNGAQPLAGLVIGEDGNLYGTTAQGGIATNGTVFRITPEGTFTNLHMFSGPEGANPQAALVVGVDSNFYGTTLAGGANGLGTVFSITAAGVLTNLYSFSGPDGANPYAALVVGSDSNFYGTTFGGGAYDLGTVFSITSAGVLTNLYSFSGPEGAKPTAPLVEGLDGNFYGATHYGGAFNYYGTLFSISPTGNFTNLFSFAGFNGGGVDGAMILGVDSNFYGTANAGLNGVGTVFRFSVAGGYTNLYSFAISDGANPHAALVLGSDGIFYGTTENGGLRNTGVVFGITSDGTLTNLTVLRGKATGINPRSALVQAANGLYYGTTKSGGTNQQGNIFTFSPCEFGLDVTNVTAPFTGGTSLVHVTPSNVNCGWTAYSQSKWISLQPATNACAGAPPCPDIPGLVCGCSSGAVVFAVESNPSQRARLGFIVIAGQTVTVAQCSFALKPNTINVTAAGGLRTISVKAGRGCEWSTIQPTNSADAFIQITKGLTGNGNGHVGLFISPNGKTTGVTGTVNIAGYTVQVIQQGAPCQLTLLPNSSTITGAGSSLEATFPAAGGSSNVVVDANGATCAWAVDNKLSFVTITSKTNFTGTGTVIYNVSSNATTKARSGDLTIAGQTYQIKQNGAP